MVYLPKLKVALICQLLETSEDSMSGYSRAGLAAERLQVDVPKAIDYVQNDDLGKMLMAKEI